ncbi:MAG: hypothetical protein IKK39_05365 [Thermoguttaceae bacterium]|nr:hypothetical protein [Thermoguttaceae bacterium]
MICESAAAQTPEVSPANAGRAKSVVSVLPRRWANASRPTGAEAEIEGKLGPGAARSRPGRAKSV